MLLFALGVISHGKLYLLIEVCTVLQSKTSAPHSPGCLLTEVSQKKPTSLLVIAHCVLCSCVSLSALCSCEHNCPTEEPPVFQFICFVKAANYRPHCVPNCTQADPLPLWKKKKLQLTFVLVQAKCTARWVPPKARWVPPNARWVPPNARWVPPNARRVPPN